MAPYTLGPIIFLLWGWCVGRAHARQTCTRRRSPLVLLTRPAVPPRPQRAGCPSCTPGLWDPRQQAAARLRRRRLRWSAAPASACRAPSSRRRRRARHATTAPAPTPTSSRLLEPRAPHLRTLHTNSLWRRLRVSSVTRRGHLTLAAQVRSSGSTPANAHTINSPRALRSRQAHTRAPCRARRHAAGGRRRPLTRTAPSWPPPRGGPPPPSSCAPPRTPPCAPSPAAGSGRSASSRPAGKGVRRVGRWRGVVR